MSDSNSVVNHPCAHWKDGCAHPAHPYGAKPSMGVCLKVCDKYDGPSRGLGDTIERFTRITGIKKLVENRAKKTGKPCNCGENRAALNRAIPYKQK